jgi:hypothetical protein
VLDAKRSEKDVPGVAALLIGCASESGVTRRATCRDKDMVRRVI